MQKFILSTWKYSLTRQRNSSKIRFIQIQMCVCVCVPVSGCHVFGCHHRAWHISSFHRNFETHRFGIAVARTTFHFESTHTQTSDTHNVVEWFSAACSAVVRLITSEVSNRQTMTVLLVCVCVCHCDAKDDTTAYTDKADGSKNEILSTKFIPLQPHSLSLSHTQRESYSPAEKTTNEFDLVIWSRAKYWIRYKWYSLRCWSTTRVKTPQAHHRQTMLNRLLSCVHCTLCSTEHTAHTQTEPTWTTCNWQTLLILNESCEWWLVNIISVYIVLLIYSLYHC